MQTSYTMAEIKSAVNLLKNKALDQHRTNCKTEFKNQIVQNTEAAYDIKLFNDSVKIIHELINKYNDGNRYISKQYRTDSLYTHLESLYIQTKSQEYNKIYDQFAIIESRLKTIRNPDKALEFLQLCGIELPESNKAIQPDSPVDVDFIKSVLPKNVLLAAGPESEVNYE